MKSSSIFKKGLQFCLLIVFITSLFIGLHSTNRDTNIFTNTPENSRHPMEFTNPITISKSLPRAEWWNTSFQYRKQINITNQYDYDLNNFKISFQFNYSQLVSLGKMQNDLEDIRIVENGTLLRYYYIKNSPTAGLATVWFETNVSATSSYYYSYMYYGNDTVSKALDYYDDEYFGMLWYDFEDYNSSTARDLMGKNNGTIFDVGDHVNYVTGHAGNYALDFDDTQTEAYISIPNDAINGIYNFTICFWATAGHSGEYLISGSYAGNHNYMLMRSPTAAGWHFYIWMRNGTTPHIYTDLVRTDGLIYSNPGNPVYISPGGLIWAQEQDSLGGSFDPNQAFSGSIDDIKFFNHDLSYTELIWLFNNYTLDISLLGEEVASTEFTVFVKDIEGNSVPGAEVNIYNQSDILYLPVFGYFTKNTTSSGSVTFEGVPFGMYNITVNYTSTEGLTEIVNISLNVQMNEVQQNFTINTILWTINFNITDIDYQPMETGWVIVKNFTSGQTISNITVNSSGIAIFRWLNHTVNWTGFTNIYNVIGYNYSVFYNNSLYNGHPLLVNESMVPNIIYFHQNLVFIITNLTTLNFLLYSKDTSEILNGATIFIFRDNNTDNHVVNLSAPLGIATFRWVKREAPENYTMRIWFYSYKEFNVSESLDDLAYFYNFTLTAKKNLTFYVAVNPANFKTELISMNPSPLIVTYISYDIEFYVLFNITSNPGGTNGTAWADSVVWTLKRGTTILNSGSFERIENSQYDRGLYFLKLNTIDEGIIDTSKIYILQVRASKSGFGEPQNLYYTLSVNELPTQFSADRSLDIPIGKYWKQNLTVLFNYQGVILEEIEIQDSYPIITNHSGSVNLEPYITSFTNHWNLTGLFFNFSAINTSSVLLQWPEFIKMNVTYGSNKYEVINGINPGFGYVNITKENLNLYQNSYQFGVEGNGLSNYSVQVTAYFERYFTSSKTINSNDSKTQGTLTIDGPNDYRNLVYIKFEIFDIKNTSDFIVNASDVLMNITIPGYGDTLNVMDTGTNGQGVLELSNYTIIPINSRFNFTINSTEMKSYSINITSGFESTFKKQDNLESTQTSQFYTILYASSTINVTEPVDSWNLTRLLIEFTNLNETSINKTFYPSQANMSVWHNGINYIVLDGEVNGSGYVIIPLINENGNKTLVFTITTNLSTLFTYDAQFQRSFKYQELLPLSDADVSWQYSTLSGDISEISAGNYNFTLNTSVFLPTSETKLIHIVATKEFYQTNSSSYVKLILNERVTLLNSSRRNFYEIQFYALQSALISFNYTDELSGNTLKSDALGNVSATFSWYDLNDPNNVYNGNLTEVGNYFVLDFDTDLKKIGKYVIAVNIKRDNYSQPTILLFLSIQQRPIKINLVPPVITLPQKTASMIFITLEDEISGNTLTGFEVNYFIDGIPMGSLIDQGDGNYMLPVTAATLAVGGHYILISMEHDNYTMPISAVSLTVTYEQIFGIDAPIFYTIIIAVAVVIAALSIYTAIKSARIPYVIKKIDETIKFIEKGKDKINSPIMKSKELIFLEKFGSDWQVLSLEPPIKPIKVRDETIEEFKDLLYSMKGIKMTIKEIENLKLKLRKISENEATILLQSMGIPPDASEKLIKLAKNNTRG